MEPTAISLLRFNNNSVLISGLAVRHDVDGDVVLHLRDRRHADVRQHRAQPQHGHREAQQLQAHRSSLHDALQVKSL